jgi:hypothetical protein
MYRTIDAAFWTEQLTGIARRADFADLPPMPPWEK